MFGQRLSGQGLKPAELLGQEYASFESETPSVFLVCVPAFLRGSKTLLPVKPLESLRDSARPERQKRNYSKTRTETSAGTIWIIGGGVGMCKPSRDESCREFESFPPLLTRRQPELIGKRIHRIALAGHRLCFCFSFCHSPGNNRPEKQRQRPWRERSRALKEAAHAQPLSCWKICGC